MGTHTMSSQNSQQGPMEKPNRRTRLTHQVIVQAPGLLPMLYTLREISTELGVPDSTLRDWLDAGAPHHRDDRNHIWINDVRFAAWVKTQQTPRPVRKLGPNEAYCLRCNQVTQLLLTEIRPIKGKLIHIKGKCSQCGNTINRGDRLGRTTELP